MDYTNSAFTKYIIHGLAFRMDGVEKEIESLQTTIRKLIERIDNEANKRMIAVPKFTFKDTHQLPDGFTVEGGEIYSLGFEGIPEQEYTRYFATSGRTLDDFDGGTEFAAGTVVGGKGLFYTTGAIKKTEGVATLIERQMFFTISADASGGIKLEQLGESLVPFGIQLTGTEVVEDHALARPLIVKDSPIFITDEIVDGVAVSSSEISSWGLRFSQPICGCEYARALGAHKPIVGTAP